MNLSVETKVAAAVAAGFLAVTVGVVAQGNSEDQHRSPNDSSPIIRADTYWQVDQQAYALHGKKSGH